MHGEIDRIGLKMLRLLQGNGRLTNAELAHLVDVSPATCHRRTQALFEDGSRLAYDRLLLATGCAGREGLPDVLLALVDQVFLELVARDLDLEALAFARIALKRSASVGSVTEEKS